MFYTTSKQVTKAGLTVCSAVSAKTCPAVFAHLLAISHLRRRLRTYQNLRGNTADGLVGGWATNARL